MVLSKRMTRVDRWTVHLNSNAKLLALLKECDPDIDWPSHIAQIYSQLSDIIHKPAIDYGDGTYIARIRAGLPKATFCFIKAIVKVRYEDHVEVQEFD